jgi:uncharacterized protein (DUF2384 family)
MENTNTLGISQGLYNYGIMVFGEEEKFIKWWNSPIRALGNKKPSEVSELEARTILTRIEYGIYS